MRRALQPVAFGLLTLLSLAAFGVLAWYFSQGHGRLDFADHARGRDFVNLWTAGRLIGEGRTLEVFDPVRFMAAHHRLFSPRLPFHFWSYPPPALLLAAPFALTPGYFAALAGWTAATWLALLPAAWAVTGPDRAGSSTPPPCRWAEPVLLALCPAVATNIGLGQNGAVSAALLLGGLALLDRRPIAAGALLGLLVFKPQLALLLPVMVLAGRRWRVLWGAAASAGGVLALSTAVFGFASWSAFVHGALPMQSSMLREGRGPFIAMMASAFMAARELRIDWRAALGLQAPFTALGVWIAWRAFRDEVAGPAERAALLAAATFIATPQVFNYDLIPSAFCALVLLRPRVGGARAGWAADTVAVADLLLAAAAWALPVAMLELGRIRLPLAPVVLTLLALRLAQREGALWPTSAGSGPRRAARASQMGEAASHT